jgi:hypothetical protein
MDFSPFTVKVTRGDGLWNHVLIFAEILAQAFLDRQFLDGYNTVPNKISIGFDYE